MKSCVKVRLAALVLLAAFLLPGCAGPAASSDDGRTVTDSSGREVIVPEQITRIAPSGSIATMILATIAPEYFVSIHGAVDEMQADYLPEELHDLPEVGQVFGGKGNFNKEALLAAGPQVILDLGDAKEGIAADLDALQEQTGVPTLFIEADLDHLAEAYRTLGALLEGKAERGEKLAAFVEETLAMAAGNEAAIAQDERLSAMFVTERDGIGTNAAGSTQTQVLDRVGVDNAVVLDEISNKGGGSTLSMEQVYRFDPDVLLFTPDSYYETAATDPLWTPLRAVSDGAYYEIPAEPYNWLCMPTSVNMLLGVWWLGNLLYPEVYDYDMLEKTCDIYKLLWDYDMSAEQAAGLLARSTCK